MFVTLSGLRRPAPAGHLGRIRQRLWDKIRPPRPSVERVALLGSFFVDIRMPAGGVFTPEQQRIVRQSSRFGLCAPGMELPPTYRPAATPQEIGRVLAHILCNTAVRALEQSALPLYCRCVGVVDGACAYPFLLERLIKYTPVLLVCTQAPALYQQYAEQVMEVYGAPVTFTENPAALRQATMVLALDETALPPLYPCPVLSLPVPTGESGNLCLHSPGLSFPQADAALPPGIGKYAFYTALYGRCQVGEVLGLRATDLVCAGRRAPAGELAGHLLQNQQKAPGA